MSKYFAWLKTDKAINIMMVVKVFIILVLLYLYLLHADLSTAPDFIYNQF